MSDIIGQQFGGYHLLSLLGKGGFANVYLGEHVYLKTQAAVKVLQTSLTGSSLDEFLKEARTVAHLEHPNIVRVLDFGVADSIPFLVMTYAPNGSLRQRYPVRSVLPLATVVSYVKQVASALQYAHDGKIIHRDVKPENMLLGRNNEILLSDFGIAMATQTSRYQGTQEIVGTVAYMSPEQIQGKPRPASDQYALAVVVYEWLSGSRPFRGGFTELCAQHMFAPPQSLQERIPGISPVIDEVVQKALAKEPQQRFANVQAFADTLEKAAWSPSSRISPPVPPLSAFGPDGPYEPTFISPPLAQRSSIPTPPAPPNASSSPITPPPPPPLTLTEPVVITPATPQPAELSKKRVSRRAILTAGLGLAGLVAAGGGVAWLTTHPATLLPAPTPTPRTIGTHVYIYGGHSSFVEGIAWSPDSKRIASGSNDRTVQVWDSANGGNVLTYRGHTDVVPAVAWSPPDGTRIASGSADRTVQIWHASSLQPIQIIHGHAGEVRSLAWSPDGTRIASASFDKTVQVWDASSGNHLFTCMGHTDQVYAVTWSPDGTRIASASFDKTVQVWDASSGTHILTYPDHNAPLRAVAWSPDGKYIVSGGDDSTALVWDPTTGETKFHYSGHHNQIWSLAWSPDSKRIVSGSADTTVQVWDALTGRNAFPYRGHTSYVYVVAWSPDGQHIASGGDDKTVQVWLAI